MTRWQVNNRCIRSFCVRLLSKWYYSTGVDSSIGIVTKLRAGRLRNRASIPGRKKRVLGVTKTRTHFAPGDLSPGLKRSESGAVHSSTLRSLRMSGAVPTLPHIFPWRAQWHLYISELPKIFCFLYATSHILQPKSNPIFSIFDNYCMLHVRVPPQLLPHF